MKNNKGITLIELIIVVAIISILGGYGLSKTEAIQGYEARETYDKLETSISDCKVSTMSWSQLGGTVATMSGAAQNDKLTNPSNNAVYMEIYKKASDNCYYYTIHINNNASKRKTEEVKIGTSRVKISYALGSKNANVSTLSETEITGDEHSGLIIAYNRSTGAFLPHFLGGTGVADTFVRKISIAGGTREYVLTLMPETGKVLDMKEAK